MLQAPQVLRAIGAELTDLHKEAELAEGSHAMNLRLGLTVTGAVEQLAEQLVTPTVTLPLPVVIALVAQRAGVKADALYAILIDAAVEAARAGTPASEWVDVSTKALKDAREKVQAKLKKVPKRGPLRRILTIADVSIDGMQLAAGGGKKRK